MRCGGSIPLENDLERIANRHDSLGSDGQTQLSGAGNSLGAAADVKLAIQSFQVPLHRCLGKEEAFADLAVAHPPGD